MSSAISDATETGVRKPRTYAVGHKPKPAGLWIFGPVGTVLLGVGGVLFLAIMLINSVSALVFGLFWFMLLLVAVLKDQHGVSTVDRLNTRFGYRHHVRKSGTRKEGASYQPGVLTYLGKLPLPGVLADSELHEFQAYDGQTFTLLEYKNPSLFVVTVACDPDGAGLVSDQDIEATVARYGDWLANLAYDPDLVQVAVTVETAPDGGAGLRHEVETHRSDRASDLSKSVMGSIVDRFPESASASAAWVTFTFRAPKSTKLADGTKVKKAPSLVVAEALRTRLPNLLADLPEAGAGAVQPLTAQELIELVRCAYNPMDRKMFDQIKASGAQAPVLDWDHAGPTASRTPMDRYYHSGCTSMTWETTGFTTNQVIPRALVPLLEGSPDVTVSRTTWLYQVIDPAKSATLAETDHRAASARVLNSKKPTSRDLKLVDDANQARTDEAHGSALVNLAILHTATVIGDDPAAITAAREAVNRLAPTSRLRMRPMHGVEDSAFAQAAGYLGLVTSMHLAIPTSIKNGF